MQARSYEGSMPRNQTPPDSGKAPASASDHKASGMGFVWRLAAGAAGLLVAGALSLAMLIAIALAMAFPNLPDISELSDYRPILPLRVFFE
jgi:penicillin-binding protein 1A